MKPFDRLTSDIMSHLDRREGSGWWSIHCPVCKEQRTRTGGFSFEDDTIIYNCFRGKCDANCQLKHGEYVSKKFKNLMLCMGVSIPVELLVARKDKSKLAAALADDDHLYKKHSYKAIQPPDGFVRLEECPSRSLVSEATSIFESRACSTEDVFVAVDGKYKGLTGFGMYLGDKMIGFNIISKNKYISHFGGNSNVLYTPSRSLYSSPIIVVEGGLDAKCFPNTVAVLGPKITPEQAYLLRGKDVIMLPDRKGNSKFIDQFSSYGWKICIPSWTENDLNEAVCSYGVLVVAKKIAESTTKDLLTAKMRYKLWAI